MKSPNVTRTVAFGTSVTFSLEYVLRRWLAIYSSRYFRRRLEHKPLSPLPPCDSHQLALCRHVPPTKILLANSPFARTARGLQSTQSHFVHCAD
jgi:hypothetical protein